MKNFQLEGPSLLHYAYGVLVLFDASEKTPEIRWVKQHARQGFARRALSVHFATLKQEGKAVVNVFDGQPEDDLSPWARVISVPLNLPSGQLNIQGLEEWPIERFIKVPPATYMITLAQRFDRAADRLILGVFIDQSKGLNASQVLKSDELLSVPDVLCESADALRK